MVRMRDRFRTRLPRTSLLASLSPERSHSQVRMTPTWETVTADDLSGVWLECEVRGDLVISVGRSTDEFGYVATLHDGMNVDDIEIDSPVTRSQEEAKQMGEAMLEQYLMDIAAESMALAGAE